jgi:catechol 2,3-dioxygenase
MTTTNSIIEKVVGIRPEGFRAAETAHVGWVRLAVSSLEKSVEFYTRVIGLRVSERSEKSARLTAQGDDQVLIELAEEAGLKPLNEPRLGLYHFAILLPTREDLSAFVNHASALGVRFGAGDHIYSEAIYLNDPDGLGVEVYADRPRESWPVAERRQSNRTGEIEHVLEYAADTLALNFNKLPVSHKWMGAPAGTEIGHVHLSVGELPSAARFYHQGLGLDMVTWSFPGALFVSAGGYHHRVGLNTWSTGARSAGAADPRLLYWTLVLPNAAEVARAAENLRQAGFESSALLGAALPGIAFKDPWGTVVALITEGSVV